MNPLLVLILASFIVAAHGSSSTDGRQRHSRFVDDLEEQGFVSKYDVLTSLLERADEVAGLSSTRFSA